jgi:outer membrane lipoprotein-sorting protein
VIATVLLATAMLATDLPELESFLAEFSAKRTGLASMQATFQQEIITPDGTEKLSGALLFAKPRRIVFRYDDPADALLIDGYTIYEFWTDIEQVNVQSLADEPQAEALYLGFDSDLKRLQEAYDLSLETVEGEGCGNRVLTLRPKPSEDGTPPLFERVRLFLRPEDLLPCKILIVNNAESRVQYQLADIAVNAPLEPAHTQLQIPAGWSIVEADMPVVKAGELGLKIPKAIEAPEDAPVPAP